MFDDGTSWPLRASCAAVLGSIGVVSQAMDMCLFPFEWRAMGMARTPRVVSAETMVFQMAQAKGVVLEWRGRVSNAKSRWEKMMASKIGENEKRPRMQK